MCSYLALAVAGAIALAAVQLLPTAEYLLQSQRSAAVEYEAAMAFSFWPWRFLSLFAPEMFGNPVQADFWGSANYWEDAIYIGLLPVLLALGSLLRYFWTMFRRKSTDAAPQAGESLGLVAMSTAVSVTLKLTDGSV